MRGGLEPMFKHSNPIDPFGITDNDDSENDSDDDGDNGDIDVNDTAELDMEGPTYVEGANKSMKNGESIDSSLALIEKLVEEAKEEAIAGGIQLVRHMQAMMTKVLTDVKRIRSHQASNSVHPQIVFETVNDGLGNSIVRKPDFHEKAMSSQGKRKRTCFCQ